MNLLYAFITMFSMAAAVGILKIVDVIKMVRKS